MVSRLVSSCQDPRLHAQVICINKQRKKLIT